MTCVCISILPVLSFHSFISLPDLKSTSGIIRSLLYLSPARKILYITDTNAGAPTRDFEHLSCFYPGLLALGAYTLKGEMDEAERQLHLWAAEGLAYSCWLMYADQETGLGPEIARMNKAEDGKNGLLWIDAVREWEGAGKPLGKPPGVGVLAEPMPGVQNSSERDYTITDARYQLRPEVRVISFLYKLAYHFFDLTWPYFLDDRKPVRHVAYDGRRGLARALLGHLPCHRKPYADPVRLRQLAISDNAVW